MVAVVKALATVEAAEGVVVSVVMEVVQVGDEEAMAMEQEGVEMVVVVMETEEAAQVMAAAETKKVAAAEAMAVEETDSVEQDSVRERQEDVPETGEVAMVATMEE